MSENTLLQTIGLGKEFGKVRNFSDIIFRPFTTESITVLQDISLEIRRSEVVCLFGVNGAGKTTLMKILSGILLSSGGQILVEGKRIDDSLQLRQAVSCELGDERSFYWRLTAQENLEFFGSLCGVNPRELRRRLKGLFDFFEIENPHRRFYEYPSGLKQRFSIIRGLVNNPSILLLDEPTKNLDCVARERWNELIRQKVRQRGRESIIISTISLDDPGMLESYDKIVILHQGRIRAQGTRREVQNILNVSCLRDREIVKTFEN